MGSIGISDETEFLPSSVILCEKLKFSRKLLDDNDAVNHASIPRRLRSAMKRRGHASQNASLTISLKENHLCNEIGMLRKNGLKKSKLNMLRQKPGQITKDEEEVAEALYSLAGMFSDAAKTDKPGLDRKPNMAQSSAALETGNAIIAMEDTRILSSGGNHMKIGKKVHVEVACHSSSILDLPQVKFKSLDDSSHLEFLFNKQSPLSVSSGVQSHSSINPRLKTLELDAIPNGRAISQEQVVASDVKYLPNEDKRNGLFLHPSSSSGVTQSSETHESFPRTSINKLPAWFDNTNCAAQSCVTEETATKKNLVEAEPRRPWKRCCAHVHISRWIKLSQAMENPTQIKIGQLDLEPPFMNLENEKQRQTGGTKSSASSSSSKQCSDFLSLAAGGGTEGSGGAGQHDEAAKQLPLSYQKSQNSAALFFSQPQNCSSLHGQPYAMTVREAQQQLPPFLSDVLGDRVTAQTIHHWELQQPKWADPSPLQLCTAGVSTQYFPMLRHGEMESPALFHNERGSRQHQFPQQQFAAMSSWMSGNRSLSLGFERNRDMSCPDKISRLKLPCNQQHL